MRRRHFISLLGGAALALPLPASAQQGVTPVVGFLHSGSKEQNGKRLAAFIKGLNDQGFVEGRNVAIEYRWAEGDASKLPELAADLVRRRVAVIATPGSTPASIAAKTATSTVPVVFGVGANPVTMGLVKSLNRPGGNVTGVSSMNGEIGSKKLSVLRELAPQAAHYFAVLNPTSALAKPFLDDLRHGASGLGVQVALINASSEQEIDAAFANLPRQPGNVMLFAPDSLFYIRRAEIAALMMRYAVPGIFDVRDYVEAGALVSYGNDFLNVMELAGKYCGEILKGAKPAELPVVQADKFELVINLKTAKILGLSVSDKLLALANDVIE
jgi:putative ABC transport system substrate-binding protein